MTKAILPVSRNHTSPSQPSRRKRPLRVQSEDVLEHKKKLNRERQKKYRDRQRTAAINHENQTSQTTECFSGTSRNIQTLEASSTTTYIATHQKRAVDDFFDRLNAIADTSPLCHTCKESYHGIRMSGLQCERCSKERNGHRFVEANNADPGVLTGDLVEILHDLTQMEEMLCSLASPFFLMWVSKGGQYKSRGNVISFSQDISTLCTTLPRLPEELDVLIVKKQNARDPSSYNDFRVRKHKVYNLLLFLKRNNPYYSTINIRDPGDVDLPNDGSILERLPSVNRREESDDEHIFAINRSANCEDEEEHYVPDELAQEQNNFLPNILPDESELEAIHSGMRSAGLSEIPANTVLWPTLGDPLSEYTTNGLFTKAFPSLFPFGKSDFSLPRQKTLQLHEWVKHLLRFQDSRFATHPRFRFFALNLIFRHRAMGRGKFLFARDVGNRDMTVGQLRSALQQQGGNILSSKIVCCLQTVRGTRPYWHMEGAKLRDMITQIGTPTLFYTLSMADLSWPDLHRFMPENPFNSEMSSAESYRIRSRNLANNPHIVSSYLTVKHKHLRDTIFNHLNIASEDRVLDFWYRIEWQARGSGHIHGFLWLENAPPIDNMDWEDSDDLERIRHQSR